MTKLVVGTRGSKLAVAQCDLVIEMLRASLDGMVEFEKKIIRTSGDEPAPRQSATGKDLFTREIDGALLRGDIDFAVHSLKDIPIESGQLGESEESTGALKIAAYPRRDSPFDVLVPRSPGETLLTLPIKARIGTSSLRRQLQLRSFRPDFEIVKVRGNVPTRIEKMESGELGVDAIVLAEAGLRRLGVVKDGIFQVIPKDVVLPAPGQGSLAVAVRSGDERTEKIVNLIDDKYTRYCVTAERAFAWEIGGGCNTPVAALATSQGETISLEGLVAGAYSESGTESKPTVLKGRIAGRLQDAESLGIRLACDMKQRGSIWSRTQSACN